MPTYRIWRGLHSVPGPEKWKHTRRCAIIYNRYIPNENGSYQRQTVAEPERTPPPPRSVLEQAEEKTCTPAEAPRHDSGPRGIFSSGLDAGDLLLLCIVLLLLLESDEEDMLSLLITAAAFLFL